MTNDDFATTREWNKYIKVATAKMLMGALTQGQLKAILDKFEQWKKVNRV